jgi:hypothetical protein
MGKEDENEKESVVLPTFSACSQGRNIIPQRKELIRP